jgi:hypothetical protein
MKTVIPQTGCHNPSFKLDEHHHPAEEQYEDKHLRDGVFYLGCIHQVTIDMYRLYHDGTHRPSFSDQLAEAVDILKKWYVDFDDLRSARINLILKG